MKRPLLMPLIPLYAAGLRLRETRLRWGWEPVQRLKSPVISIGNLSAGGAGKTPLTITLARLLSARGYSVDVLSRGYGRSSREAARVQPGGRAEQFGDEPLLIAREANVPVYVAANRIEAGRLAEVEGLVDKIGDGRQIEAPYSPPHIHILDDGFQHRQLARNVDILLIDREDWHDHLLPGGNLREALQAGKRASAIAIPATDPNFEEGLRAWGWNGPVWRICRRMELPHVAGPVAAFCGIARPEQFLAGLRAGGLSIAETFIFPDHHRYSPGDVRRLVARSRQVGATALLTTEKDKIRLGDLLAEFPASPPLKTAHLQSQIEDEQTILTWIEKRIANSAAKQPV